MDLLTVMVYPTDGDPYLLGIPKTLEAMQQVVGGYIEMVRPAADLILVCNEEGVGLGLPVNPHTMVDGQSLGEFVDLPDGAHIMGTYFVAGTIDGNGELSNTPERIRLAGRDPALFR